MPEKVIVADIEFRAWKGRPGRMTASHIHSDIEINFLLSGEIEYLIGGKFETLRAGSLNLFWAGIPHVTMRRSEDAQILWVVVPLAWCLQWQVPAPLMDELLLGRMWRVPVASPLQTELMLRWCEDFESANQKSRLAQTKKIVALEAEAFLKRLALEPQIPTRKYRPSSPRNQAEISHVEKLAAYVARHYRDDLTIQEVAGSVSLHPNYAMQLFRAQCGLSLWEYVLRLRISHAQYLLLTTNRKLSDISREAGFQSPSRFYAAFEKYSGCAPRNWREQMDAKTENGNKNKMSSCSM